MDLYLAFIPLIGVVMAFGLPLVTSIYIKDRYHPVNNGECETWYNQTSILSESLCEEHQTVPVIELLLISVWISAFIIATPETSVQITVDCIFISVLVTLALVDMKYMILPNPLTYGLIIGSLVWAWVGEDLNHSLAGVFFGAGIPLVIVGLYYMYSGKIGMGMGDIKLFAGIGAFLGAESLWFIIVTANILGLFYILISKVSVKGKEFSFGHFIAIAAILWMLSPVEINALFSLF